MLVCHLERAKRVKDELFTLLSITILKGKDHLDLVSKVNVFLLINLNDCYILAIYKPNNKKIITIEK